MWVSVLPGVGVLPFGSRGVLYLPWESSQDIAKGNSSITCVQRQLLIESRENQ